MVFFHKGRLTQKMRQPSLLKFLHNIYQIIVAVYWLLPLLKILQYHVVQSWKGSFRLLIMQRKEMTADSLRNIPLPSLLLPGLVRQIRLLNGLAAYHNEWHWQLLGELPRRHIRRWN